MNSAKTKALCAAVAFSALLSSPAAARPVVVTAPVLVVRHVTYADLNLATAEGAKRLDRRVGSAISDVCVEANDGNNGSFDFKVGMISCSSSAWNQARPQISLAVQRARQLAATGTSAIAATSINISAGR
jgi:UrcA family protein